jgi:hypothetical protein
MASISNVTMSIATGTSSIARSVTVNGTLTFDASDVGRTYRLAIALVGEDKSGDKLPASDPVGDDDIYDFKWGIVPLLIKPYKSITVAAPGTQTFSETRSVNNVKLDEDTGTVPVNYEPDINTPLPGFPRRDEVYARATLGMAPVSARSTTVIAGIGV